MYDEYDEELDSDDWTRDEALMFAPKMANDEYVDGLGRQIFSLLDGAFPGQVQVANVMFERGNYTIQEGFADEAAEHQFAAKAFPVLKQEIVRQVRGLGALPGDWTVRFEVDGSTSRERGADTDPYAAVSVLVVEGPRDPDFD